MTLLTRKRALLAKIESVYGTDPTPTGSANAILMSNFNVSPMEMTLAQRNNIKNYLGNNPSVLAAIYAKVSFDVELAGSGTAGTAPAYGPLLRACGMSESALATAVTGTATAGSSTTITLVTGASVTDDAYKGMTINLDGGTGSGQSGVIQSYVGSTLVATVATAFTTPPDATTTYTIPAQVAYQPISVAADAYESVTFYCGVDGVRHKMTGARGNAALKLAAQAIPMMTFTFSGIFSEPTDSALPTTTLTAFHAPLAVNSTNTSGLVIAGYSAAVGADMSFDLANSIVFRSLPGSAEKVLLTDRKPSGSFQQEATLVASKDWWADIKGVTLGQFSVKHGTTAGNILKIDAPAVQITTPAYGDKDGITMLTTKADFIPVIGNDEIYLSIQ